MASERLTRLQGIIAVASFGCGVLIGSACLFAVPPYGQISNSAISIVSELLVLAGALLGVKTNYDLKMSRFDARLEEIDKEMEARGRQYASNAEHYEKI